MPADLFFVLDQGTTEHKLVVFDRAGRLVDTLSQAAPPLVFHQDGLGFDPADILKTSDRLILQAQKKFPHRFFAFGFANQGESVVAWDRETGKSLSQVISWQCQASSDVLQNLKGQSDVIKKVSGLYPSPYFSAAKLAKLLRTNDAVQRAAQVNHLALGTLDAWAISHWTRKKLFVTDPTTACRTQLFDLQAQAWSDELISLFGLKKELLPQVCLNDSFEILCDDGPFRECPLLLVQSLCDQPAGLIGHGGLTESILKLCLGTGAFVDLSLDRTLPQNSLLTSILYAGQGLTKHYLEGGVLSFGSALDWCERVFKINRAKVFESLYQDTGLWVFPAFSGVGAPHFLAEQHSVFDGISLMTSGQEIGVALMQSLIFRIAEIISEMSRLIPLPETISMDGGLSQSRPVLQFLADVLQKNLILKDHPQATASGVARLILNKMKAGSEHPRLESLPTQILSPRDDGPHQMYLNWQDRVKAYISVTSQPILPKLTQLKY